MNKQPKKPLFLNGESLSQTKNKLTKMNIILQYEYMPLNNGHTVKTYHQIHRTYQF